MKKITAVFTLAGAAVGLTPSAAFAQDDLMALGMDELRSEVQRRYDAGLAMTNDNSVVAANDPRYIWASETKAQCGIALGYLKSSTRDEVSLSRCALAYDMMQRAPRPRVEPAPLPTPEPAPEVCNREAPGLIFFEFDSATPQQDAVETVQYVVENAPACDWNSFTVIGHTDRAGSNAYNEGLSQRRAEAVANLMASRGIPASSITTQAQGEESPRVPTADGVRELQNRRVEIQVSE
ncbi:OmpA family protein [Qipengyuania aquimaris]|uniref:OmpA family protein n=1 Tax=Qipengyuania aquimaris TaxID=255984 RepID=UPI001CD5586F|nr:OmpA family protein [Qipengyuania aquimaris]MCA0903710.1 OmpA family protein [Qipengyuania aquimaris]